MTRPFRNIALRVAVLAVLTQSNSVRSAEANPGDLEIQFDVAPCVHVDAARVQRLFELELGTTRAGGDTPSSARVKLDCVGQLVEIRVFDTLTGKSLSRKVDPGSAAGRDRLIALAVTELLVASWAELETGSTAASTSGPSNTRAVKSARAIVRRHLPGQRNSSARTLLLATGGLQIADPRLSEIGFLVIRKTSTTWSWWADLVAQFGSDDTTLGRVTNRSLGGSVSLGPRIARGVFNAHATVGARARLVSLKGEPDNNQAGQVRAGSVAGFAAGPMAAVVVHIDLRGRFAVAFAAELGWNLLAVRGLVDGRDETGSRGAWLTFRVGLGKSF